MIPQIASTFNADRMEDGVYIQLEAGKGRLWMTWKGETIFGEKEALAIALKRFGKILDMGLAGKGGPRQWKKIIRKSLINP